MATAHRWTRDNLVAAVFVIMLVVLSWTTILTQRQSSANSRALHLIQRCVLPDGDLCKGNPSQTKALVDDIVNRVNAHTDEVISGR